MLRKLRGPTTSQTLTGQPQVLKSTRSPPLSSPAPLLSPALALSLLHSGGAPGPASSRTTVNQSCSLDMDQLGDGQETPENSTLRGMSTANIIHAKQPMLVKRTHVLLTGREAMKYKNYK